MMGFHYLQEYLAKETINPKTDGDILHVAIAKGNGYLHGCLQCHMVEEARELQDIAQEQAIGPSLQAQLPFPGACFIQHTVPLVRLSSHIFQQEVPKDNDRLSSAFLLPLVQTNVSTLSRDGELLYLC